MKEDTTPSPSQPRGKNTFHDLPPYTTPATGLLSYIPHYLLPYAELARLDKPGFIALWLVHAYGILHAGILLHTPLAKILRLLALFIPACEILMSVNFAWNDICDRDYDGEVARTRHRPLVRGALSLSASLAFVGVLAAGLIVFLVVLPQACLMYALPMAFGCFVYPLSKRWTEYPQLVLAIVLPSGIFMGSAAVGAISLPYPSDLTRLTDVQDWVWPDGTHCSALIANYLTSVIWTIFFETIYSFQDAKWDETAGIGSITRLLKNNSLAKAFLLMLSSAQSALHLYVGTITPMRSPIWPLSVGATFITSILEVAFVDLGREESCMYWFAIGNMLTGSAMLMGYAGEYWFQVVR